MTDKSDARSHFERLAGDRLRELVAAHGSATLFGQPVEAITLEARELNGLLSTVPDDVTGEALAKVWPAGLPPLPAHYTASAEALGKAAALDLTPPPVSAEVAEILSVDVAAVIAKRRERAKEEADRPRPVLRRTQRLNRKGVWVDVDVREFEQPANGDHTGAAVEADAKGA